MVNISDSYPGRKDGNYTTIFGDEDIGSLISAVHATSIKMGTELEHIILSLSNVIDETKIDAFFNKTLEPGIYIISKRMLSHKRLNFDQKPDALVVNVKPNTCKIVEIKLGDNFDTKKSHGEVDNLKRYADKLDRETTYRVSWAVCMWYAKNKTSIITGFKGTITETQALTGLEFCELVNINYKTICDKIASDQETNREYIFNKIRVIRNKYHKEKA